MKQGFLKFIDEKLKLIASDRILLAVSGGADSVAMLDLFSKTDFDCGVAHCNFHLRNKESDLDEKLVKELAQKRNFPYYKTDFETKKHAKTKRISIEMAARELRYDWFEKIRKEFDYQYIAVAHHQDDVIETFFINLTRGTGIKGLSGIKEKSGNIIRPLLFASRMEIMQYVADNKLTYRLDASNDNTQIIRNKFRHEILPLLKEINPAANYNIIQTIGHLRSAETIMFDKIEEVKQGIFNSHTEPFRIDIEKLKHLNPVESYLFEILRPFEFNSAQVSDIAKSLNAESGKSFYSDKYLLVKDREELILTTNKGGTPFWVEITKEDTQIKLFGGFKLSIQKIGRSKDLKIPTTSNFAAIDYDNLKFPLAIKEWEQGGYFFPLGMNKKKKLSDFFIDQKLSLVEKQQTLVLYSDNQAVWVIGRRLDNRFKITDSTKNILLIELKNA